MSNLGIATAVPMRRVLDIICNALDSGAFRYWIDPRTLSERWPEASMWPSARALEGVEWLTEDDRAFFRDCRRCYFAPLVEGGALTFRLEDSDGLPGRSGECVFDLAAVRRGLQVMAEKYPRHFSDIVSGDDDATTADVFVQCCVLGEVVYG
jgi:hypothetical protein